MTTRSASRAPLILVVDDEAEIRRFVRSVLEQTGHMVVEASQAEEAIRVLRGQVPRPDVLLTDIVMPGINGIALAAQAHQMIPALHVVFMSGFSRDYTAELTGSICISKPFKPAELVAAIRSALGPGPETADSGKG